MRHSTTKLSSQPPGLKLLKTSQGDSIGSLGWPRATVAYSRKQVPGIRQQASILRRSTLHSKEGLIPFPKEGPPSILQRVRYPPSHRGPTIHPKEGPSSFPQRAYPPSHKGPTLHPTEGLPSIPKRVHPPSHKGPTLQRRSSLRSCA